MATKRLTRAEIKERMAAAAAAIKEGTFKEEPAPAPAPKPEPGRMVLMATRPQVSYLKALIQRDYGAATSYGLVGLDLSTLTAAKASGYIDLMKSH